MKPPIKYGKYLRSYHFNGDNPKGIKPLLQEDWVNSAVSRTIKKHCYASILKQSIHLSLSIRHFSLPHHLWPFSDRNSRTPTIDKLIKNFYLPLLEDTPSIPLLWGPISDCHIPIGRAPFGLSLHPCSILCSHWVTLPGNSEWHESSYTGESRREEGRKRGKDNHSHTINIVSLGLTV